MKKQTLQKGKRFYKKRYRKESKFFYSGKVSRWRLNTSSEKAIKEMDEDFQRALEND